VHLRRVWVQINRGVLEADYRLPSVTTPFTLTKPPRTVPKSFSDQPTILRSPDPPIMSYASFPTPPYHFERLDKSKAILLIVDHQLGLLQLVKDYTPTEFRNNVLAHAALGPLFNLPTILTTSAETGPNGPLPKEILQMYPDGPLIKRNGEVNAWDNPDFRAAVEATGRKQVILGGIVTEVCTMFLALSLREAGYSVWANTEASGTGTSKLAEDANRRMENAGVHLVRIVSFRCDGG
jgi:nicotinamidase-related amidase